MAKPESPRKPNRELERKSEDGQKNKEVVPRPIDEMPPQLRALLGKLPPAERHQMVAFIEHRTTTTISSEGGMPDPELLRDYQAIWPEAVEFFTSEMKLQANHRRSMEAIVFPGDVTIAKRGQLIAAGLSIFVLLIGVYLIERGFAAAGISAFGLLGAGFVTQFLRETFKKKPQKPPE